MVVCKQCGSGFDEQYRVCPKCGNIYKAEEYPSYERLTSNTLPELKEYSDEKPAQNKKSKTKLFVIIGIIAAVVIAGIITGIVLLTSTKGGMSAYDEQISLGEKYLSEENYDDAIAAFKKAIEIDPYDPEGYIRLADAYLAKGDKNEAVKVLEEGLSVTGSEEIRKKLDDLKKRYYPVVTIPEESGTENSVNIEESYPPETSDTSKEESSLSETSAIFIVASGECGSEGDNVTWGLFSDGHLGIGGKGKMKDFSSTSKAQWYEHHSHEVKTVSISEGVTSIGDYAFLECYNLSSITIPDSVTSIGDYAFVDCSNLISITIPEGVTSIEEGAFSGWTSSQTIYIKGRSSAPSGWDPHWNGSSHLGGRCEAKIVWDTETDNTSKEESELPETSDTRKEESKSPETSVISIVDSGECGAEGDNVKWELDSNGQLTISGNGKMKDYSNTSDSPWFGKRKGIKTVSIKSGVTSIGNRAFYLCENLTTITIPDSVTSIGNYAFDACSSLTNIAIPDSVTYIADWAFTNCKSLTSIILSDSITSIGNYLFSGCTSLTSITIPDSVISIGMWAFGNCSGLTSITISDSVTSIGVDAFWDCTSLSSITIPESVTDMKEAVFFGWTSSQTIYIKGRSSSPREWSSVWYFGSKAQIVWNA